jgi:Uma2 family endonuclease
MALTTRRLTIEDVEALPEEHPGDRHELIDGELFVTPVPLDKHQAISGNIVYALESLVRQQQLGLIRTAPSGVRLSPDTLVIPDVYFVSHSQMHHLGAKGMEGPPDLVVEILSPGTRPRDLQVKRELYARFKVPEYWIVDPDTRMIAVLTLAEDGYEQVAVGEGGTIESRVLPRLKLSFEQVFAGT